MKRIRTSLFGLIFIFLISLIPFTASSAKLDPAIKKYQDEMKKKREREKRDHATRSLIQAREKEAAGLKRTSGRPRKTWKSASMNSLLPGLFPSSGP
jgi:hypothetical protein